MRRTESKVASKTMVFLNLPEGKFVLLPDEKVYASISAMKARSPGISRRRWRSRRRNCCTPTSATRSYQKLGTEIDWRSECK